MAYHLLQDVVAGTWEFSENVRVSELIELATQWLLSEGGAGYQDLYIRNISPSSFGIVFKYQLPGEGDKVYTQFILKMTDQLKRRFGNDLVGWDIGQPVHQITQ